jgi:hypothetical protein
MDILGLYEKYKDEEPDKDGGFHDWQNKIFDRILEKIKDDEEATILFEYLLEWSERKAAAVVHFQ